MYYADVIVWIIVIYFEYLTIILILLWVLCRYKWLDGISAKWEFILAVNDAYAHLCLAFANNNFYYIIKNSLDVLKNITITLNNIATWRSVIIFFSIKIVMNS